MVLQIKFLLLLPVSMQRKTSSFQERVWVGSTNTLLGKVVGGLTAIDKAVGLGFQNGKASTPGKPARRARQLKWDPSWTSTLAKEAARS